MPGFHTVPHGLQGWSIGWVLSQEGQNQNAGRACAVGWALVMLRPPALVQEFVQVTSVRDKPEDHLIRPDSFHTAFHPNSNHICNQHMYLNLSSPLRHLTHMGLTAADMQAIESKKVTRTDIFMFFGVPPHMAGDTEKSTSWGTGIEQQGIGFITYTEEDHFTMWEETVNLRLLTNEEHYCKFNRAALVRGDMKARWDAHVKALQWGVSSPNEIRALEDQNPREGGDIYYDPPNTAGTPQSENEKED